MQISLGLHLAQRSIGSAAASFTPASIMPAGGKGIWFDATTAGATDGDSASNLTLGDGSTSGLTQTTSGTPTFETRSSTPIVRVGANEAIQFDLAMLDTTKPKHLFFAGFNDDDSRNYLMSASTANTDERIVLEIKEAGGIWDANELLVYAKASGSGDDEGIIIPAGAFVLQVTIDGDNTMVRINHDEAIVFGGTVENAKMANVRINAASLSTGVDLFGFAAVEGYLDTDDIYDTIAYYMDAGGLSYADRPAAVHTIDKSLFRLVTSTETISGASTQPSYFACPIYVGDNSDFDGCEDASGNRANYLMYSSSNHAEGAEVDGIYLSIIFGDPLTANWSAERIDDAITNGRLTSYSGTVPSAASVPNGLVYDGGSQFETPWVGLVGSTWVLTGHPNSTPEGGQRTTRSTASEPFGPFTPATAPVFLSDSLGTGSGSDIHSGYAKWLETPANATTGGSYIIYSLWQGGGVGTQAIFSADSSMENPSQLDTRTLAESIHGAIVPEGEFSEGAPCRIGPSGVTEVQWIAGRSEFAALGGVSSLASGAVTAFGGVGEYRFDTDLFTLNSVPRILLLPSEVDALVSQTVVSVGMSRVLPRPGGGHVVFLGASEEKNKEYVYAAGVTIAA